MRKQSTRFGPLASDLTLLNLPRPERVEKRSASLGWAEFFSTPQTSAGEYVTELRAMQQATVFAAVTAIAKAVASMPVVLYKKTERGPIEQPDHPLQYLLACSPNDDALSAVTFWETFVGHMLTAGNGYAQILRNKAGDPVGLISLRPQLTQPMRDTQTGELYYQTSDGHKPGQFREIAKQDMLHVPMFTNDGVIGLSPIAQCREMLGATIALDNFGARFFRNYATPSIVLKVDQAVSPEDKIKMRADWEALQSGSQQHRVAILDQGLGIEKLSISPDDAQFIETQRYNRSQIAAIFGVPLHLLGDDEKISRANTEELNRAFYTDCLNPIANRICSAIAIKLLPRVPGQASDYFCEFSPTARLSGDENAQMNRVKTLSYSGSLTANEARKMAGLPSLGDVGDVLLIPANMSVRKLDGEFVHVPQTATTAEAPNAE